MMRSVKDNIDRQQLKGVYKIDCSCGKSYIGETGQSLKIRLKEHGADINPVHQPLQNTHPKPNIMCVWKTLK